MRHRTRPAAVLAALATLSAVSAGTGPVHGEADRPEPPAPPAPDTSWTLLLIGDAGASQRPDFEPVLTSLARDAAVAPGRTRIVFLGDNVYPRGLPEGGDEALEAERRLRLQVAVATSTGASAIFLAGNHDWDHDAPGGWDAVRRQAEFVEAEGGGLVAFLPRGGCPGPVVLDLGRTVRLIVLDTQWWLRSGARPLHPRSDCEADAPAEVVRRLEAASASSGDRRVIVLAHHPLVSGGPHGGHFGWRKHLFPLRDLHPRLWIPLPGLGSLYPLVRRGGITDQDLSGEGNVRMREALTRALAGHEPLVWAAGHDHGLQVVEGGTARFHLVSGSGTWGHLDPVHSVPGTRYRASASGYLRLDVTRAGAVRLGVIVVGEDGAGSERYSLWLAGSAS